MVQGSLVGTEPSEYRDVGGTNKGVARAYTTERLSPSTQWDINQILDMKGTPQRLDPSKPGLSIPVKIRLEPEVKIDMPITRPARKEEGPRDVYLSKADFGAFGYTEGCRGCSRMAAGVASRPHTKQCRARMTVAIKSTPEGRRRLEEDDRKVHEHLERKLLEEHGHKDEVDRPGIAGPKFKRSRDASAKLEPAAEQPPCPLPGTEAVQSTSRAQNESHTPAVGHSTQKVDLRSKAQAGTKRVAENEADDSGRGDRVDWRNYTEPASSSGAPGAQGAPESAGADSKGTKRTAEEEADDSERAERRVRIDDDTSLPAQSIDTSMSPGPMPDKRVLTAPVDESGSPQKTPKILSVCLGIGSADKIGEVTAQEQEEELKAMADEYLKAMETGGCFVHVRTKQSSNRDLKMLSRLTGGSRFQKVNFTGADVESVITNSIHLATLLQEANCSSSCY